MGLSEIGAGYQRLIEYFVPDSVRSDREAANQARMFLISHTMGPILGNSVVLALMFVDPTPSFDILILSLSVTGFWVFPFLLRRGVDYDKLVITSVMNLNFCIFWSCYFNGGVLSPTLPWVLIIPILSFFYIGGITHLQGKLMAIFAASFALFLGAYYGFNPAPNDVPEVAMVSLGVVSTTAALCYVATMAIYYARIFDAGVELESDVRRRRQAADELRHAILAADEAGLLKAEYLARMSHELRTPLNAVIGYSQILKEEAVDSNNQHMKEDVERIDAAGKYLLRLINVILDLSKIEAGRMQFKVESTDLREIVEDAFAATRPAMLEAGNSVELQLQTSLAAVESDKLRLQQILTAILENPPIHAVGSHVVVTCAQSTTMEGYMISISDNGPGIAPERLKTIFETLTEERDASVSKYGGTGLSLSVMHKLANAIGCQLSAENLPEGGALLTLSVPRRWKPLMASASPPQDSRNADKASCWEGRPRPL